MILSLKYVILTSHFLKRGIKWHVESEKTIRGKRNDFKDIDSFSSLHSTAVF